METSETIRAIIDRLEDELDTLICKRNEKSKVAALNDVEGKCIKKQIAELANLKDAIEIKREALKTAYEQFSELKDKERDDYSLAVREEICALTDQLLDQAKLFSRSMASAGKQYKKIQAILDECRSKSSDAKDWPKEVFQHQKHLNWAYNYFINLATINLDLLPSNHLEHWPKQYIAKNASKPSEAFSGLVLARDTWRNDKAPVASLQDGETTIVSVTPEEFENAQ